MTTPDLPPPPPLTQRELDSLPATVHPESGSRLEALADRYERLKDEAATKTKELKDVTDSIKAELAAAAPGKTTVVLDSAVLSLPLKMTGVVSTRLNIDALRKDYPQVYRDYSSQSTSWKLERYKG